MLSEHRRGLKKSLTGSAFTNLYGKSGFSRKSNRPTVIMPLSLLSTERCSPPLLFASFFWQYCHFFNTKFKILIQSGKFYVVFLAILPLFRHRDHEERLLLKHPARRQPHTHTLPTAPHEASIRRDRNHRLQRNMKILGKHDFHNRKFLEYKKK